MITNPNSTARALNGRLGLRFARAGGRTVLAAAERIPPLHVQRLLYLDPCRPDLARAILLNTTAGLFAGDRLATSIEIGPDAAVEVTTPAMARAYAMPAGHAETMTRLMVAGGGYLEYVPEPTLVCADAALHTSLEIDAARDAFVAAGEVLAFGRVARGELHAYRELVEHLTVRVAGETVLVERVAFTPESDDVATALGGFAAYGCLHLLGPGVAGMLNAVRFALDTRPGMVAGASLLPADAGIAVRVLGVAPHAVHAVLRVVVGRFRHMGFPIDAIIPRHI